jgi:colicin import membrane protein
MAKSELKPIPYAGRPAGPSEGLGRVWKWVILSGIVHVVVIAYLLIGPILKEKQVPPAPVYTVDLMGGEKLGGGAGTSVRPEPPKAKPAPESPEVKSAPAEKVEKKEPARDEVKEREAREAKEAKVKAEKAEMLERIKAKKEAEEKRKNELEATRKADAEEAAARKARIEDLNKRRTEARLQDIREKIKARDAAEKAAADRAAAERQAKSTMPGDGPGAATLGHGGSGGGIQASAEFIAYRNVITNQVKNSWTWVGRRSDLKVEVNLSIKENGEIASVKLVGTSGDRSFDESVLRAIRRANPLPPPPEAFRGDFSDVNVRFSSKELGS